MSSTPEPPKKSGALLHRGVFGYRRTEVDVIMGEVEAERNALRADLASARLEVERLKAELAGQNEHESESRADVVAARQELERDRQGIAHEKEMILGAAHQLADEIQQRAQRRIGEEGWELHRARIERKRFIESFRALLSKYLSELDGDNNEQSGSLSAHPEIPPEVFSAAADRLFVPPGFEAPENRPNATHERFSS